MINIDFKRLVQLGLTPDKYCFLVSRALGEEFVFWQGFHKEMMVSDLVLSGFITQDLSLTDKSKAFLKEYSTSTINVEVLAEKVRDEFPKGVKTGGQNVRGNLKDMIKKLRKFIKDYGYTEDEILRATRMYVARYKLAQYKYMKTSSYFIHKQGDGSLLASEIDNLGEEREVTTLTDML